MCAALALSLVCIAGPSCGQERAVRYAPIEAGVVFCSTIAAHQAAATQQTLPTGCRTLAAKDILTRDPQSDVGQGSSIAFRLDDGTRGFAASGKLEPWDMPERIMTAPGAVLCSDGQLVREAGAAAGKNDTKRLGELACGRVAGGMAAMRIVVTRREPGVFVWEVRLLPQGRNAMTMYGEHDAFRARNGDRLDERGQRLPGSSE